MNFLLIVVLFYNNNNITRPNNKMDNNEEINKINKLPNESILNIANYFNKDKNITKNIALFITKYQVYNEK